MYKNNNYGGRKFSRLTALKFSSKIKGKAYWEFRCECGTKKIIQIYPVVRGKVKSCGCLHMEMCKSGVNRLKHGDARKGMVVRLHKIWRKMIGRCYCKTDKAYPSYGKRGIDICKEWKENYVNFKEWALNNGYSDKLTIDRINNNKGYSPDNCKFSTRKQQARNRRNTRLLTYKGETKSLVEWSEIIGISQYALRARIDRLEWPYEKAFKI